MIFEKQEFVISSSLGQQNGGADDGDDASPQGGTAGKVRGPSVQDPISPAPRANEGKSRRGDRQHHLAVGVSVGNCDPEVLPDSQGEQAADGQLTNLKVSHRELGQPEWNKGRG